MTMLQSTITSTPDNSFIFQNFYKYTYINILYIYILINFFVQNNSYKEK